MCRGAFSSGGNPFFALKLADALRRANLLVVHKDGVCRFSPDGDWVTVRVPPTLEVAVVSEVAGNLTAGQQLTLKIASVLGLSFSVDLLSKIHPDPASVGKDIRELVRLRHLVDAGDLDGAIRTSRPFVCTVAKACVASVCVWLRVSCRGPGRQRL